VPLIIPFHPETASATIVIDSVTYRVPLVDSDGHLQVDVLNLATLLDALASVGTDELRTRIIATLLPADAATATNQATMITALQLIDDLRGALDAVQTDRLNVNVYRDGASEVKNHWQATVSPSTTRATAITPTSGKKLRMLTVHMAAFIAGAKLFEVYFGTGATITTNPEKAVAHAVLDRDGVSSQAVSWTDGGGPVGDVDEVLSIYVTADIAGSGYFLFQYREE